MKKGKLRIEFRSQGAETCLEVFAPKSPEYVAALTEALRLTNIRAKVQFTVRKPESWLAHIRLSEANGTALSSNRASELLRIFDAQLNRELFESSKAA